MLCGRCRSQISDDCTFCPHCGKRVGQLSRPLQARTRRRPKGSGTVYKVTGRKAWVARAPDRSVIGTFPSSGDAVIALDRYNALKAPKELRNYTFRDVYNAWNPTHYKTISAKAQYSYTSAFEKSAALHNQKIADLKTIDYQAVIDSLKGSRSLAEKQRQLFSQLCQYAIKQDIIDRNYAAFLVLPPPTAVKNRILTSEEIQRIAAMTTDKRLGETAKITLALVYSGMRIGELLQLKKCNVHLEHRYVIGGEKTAAGRDRRIPIHKAVLPYYAEWMDAPGEWLLSSANGNPRSTDNLRKSFNSLMRKLDIKDVTPHTCRHTAATFMARDGVPTETIKMILGHADYATTANRYTHIDINTLVCGIDMIKSV